MSIIETLESTVEIVKRKRVATVLKENEARKSKAPIVVCIRP